MGRRGMSYSNVIYVQVAHDCNPAIGGLGHRDVHGLSATDPRLRLQISIRTMPRDAGPMCMSGASGWQALCNA